ncbi:MAG: hypothetical protein CO079_08315 [Nitrosopumilales archaeon CG_4_9_14_0_8_um_filter_34_10]|nr:MAG: hypothetical protein CO079_08315 [Nitrosopumilales archaeon CG_4_9_14_0_8_um_filter_34_10]
MNYPKAREEFIGLKHQEKKERLVRLLQIFVGNGKIFDDLINLAQKEQTSENQLIEIYESVVNAMDEVMK